ncbi:MAG: endonuclease [bacterium]
MKKLLIGLILTLTTLGYNETVCAVTLNVVAGSNTYWGYNSQLNESYYSSLSGLSGDAFRAELNDVITEDFTWYTYDTKNRYTILPKADEVYGQPGKVYCVYSGQIFNDDDCTSNGTVGYLWNTEHVWAKSHGFPSDKQTPYSDYHHLRVACKNTNSRRNNRFIGSVEGQVYKTDEWGNKYSTDTWEPLDHVKGDVARMLLYMDVRYDGEDEENEIDLVLLDDYEFPDKAEDPYMGHLSTLLEWHAQDPVDDQERYRNDVIYSYQKNRNPFVDHPEYADMVWGDGIDKDYQQVENFDSYIDSIDSNINADSLSSIAIGFVLYNKLSTEQQALSSMYSKLDEYYKIYITLSSYTEEELYVIFEFYKDYKFLDDILNGNIYDLESYI